MKLKIKNPLSLIVLLLFLNLSANRVECLFIIPSMLMAMTMTGGLLMSKMTMGGLLMMLMAANQQQNGQNFLRNLGLVPHPSPSTGISVPASSEGLVQDLIVRKRRDLNSLNYSNNAKSNNPVIDEITQYRIMRQVANSDPLGCLPAAMCGISATPPSTQSGFLNDYAYLLKTVFTRDDDLDDDDLGKDLEAEFENLTSSKKKNKNKKTKTTSANKNKKKKDKEAVNDDVGESSEEEEEEIYYEDIQAQRRREAIQMEEMANEEILTHNPDYIPFAMKDSLKLIGEGFEYGDRFPPQEPQEPPHPPEDPYFSGGFPPPGDIHKMSEAELDDLLAKFGGPPQQQPPKRTGSILSNILPKLSLGFTQKGDSSKFDDDPFFSGFKRSMEGRKLQVDSASVRPATPEEEELFKDLRLQRQRRREYIAQKRKELAEIKDPVEVFRIAAEFGQKLKSPRQCRVLFNNCPFNYTQVLGVVADLRKVILGQPLNEPQTDTVVNLKPAAAVVPSNNNGGSRNVINLNTGGLSSGGGNDGGVTSIIHQLPTGEKVEINLKMTKNGLHATRNKGNSSTVSSKRKTSSGIVSNEKIFDDDNSDNSDNNHKGHQPNSLESLKATMMAIQKINNVTVQRKKQGKPISYSYILADLTNKGTTPKGTKNSTFEDIDVKLPEPSPEIMTKLQIQNNKPPKKQSNDPQKTASLLASTLTKVEDDEADDTLPTSLVGIKRYTGPKTNQELAEILSKLKQVKKQTQKKPHKHSEKIKEEEEESAANDDDDDDEEEDEIDDMNNMYKSDRVHQVDEEQVSGTENGDIRIIKKRRHNNNSHKTPLQKRATTTTNVHSTRTILNRQRQKSPILRHVTLRQQSNTVRKPKKLFLGYDTNFSRPIPL